MNEPGANIICHCEEHSDVAIFSNAMGLQRFARNKGDNGANDRGEGSPCPPVAAVVDEIEGNNIEACKNISDITP